MCDSTTLGNVGENVRLKIRQGATCGPFEATMLQLDLDGVTVIGPVNLTGATIRGKLFKTGQTPVAVTVTYPDRVNGKYTWLFTDEQTLPLFCGDSADHPDSLWNFSLEYEDSAGTIFAIYTGTATVQRNT